MTTPWTTPRDPGDPEAQTEASKGRVSESDADTINDEINTLASEESKEQSEDAGYGDSSATYWELYSSEAQISDQKFVDTLIGDMEAMGLLNSIFSSIIASFIIQASSALQPDNNQETVCLLSQFVSPENPTLSSSQFCPPYPGKPAPALVRSNILFVISFFLSMSIVVACGLIREWCDEFMKKSYPRIAPHKRGRVRTYLFQGLNTFHMRNIMYGIRVVLFVAVVVFSCGVSDYLHNIYPIVGWVSWSCVFTAGVVYTALTLFPLIYGNCPYSTVLTALFRFCRALVLSSGHTLWRKFPPSKKGPSSWSEVYHRHRNYPHVEKAHTIAATLDPLSMKWLFKDDDFSDTDMDKFLEGLPGYLHSGVTQFAKEDQPKVLIKPYILQRIREHLLTCVTATNLSEEARVKRVLACVESLRVILLLRTSAKEEESLEKFMDTIVKNFDTLCRESKEKSDLRAFCVRALAFQGFLTKCLEQARKESPNVVPDRFIPLYTFFSSNLPSDYTLHTQPRDTPANEDPRWRVLLNNGPFINLTLLAEAIHSRGEDVDPSSVSMCSNILDMLRREFRIDRVDVPDPLLTLFDKVHKETHTRVEDEELGFGGIPLLEVLDAVDGGRRLSKVFPVGPNSKSHPKADLVFGKENLRNPDLFRAFAKCLPHFLTNQPPAESAKLMKGLVDHDYLWSSLQDHLSNSLRPNNSVPAILRVFQRCCTVIDAAFVALEKSEVDWRATDFGSLAHYFEIFATDCFRGVFLERAVGFRVGLIKARFCRAVLAQFLDEFNPGRTVVFRSHWDVASLARVLYSLGVGDDADEKFWKSFVDGGPVGPELMDKTPTSLDKAARDGRLLNFCRLGYLGMMAVPFKGSGLEDTDFEKLLDLLEKIKEDPGLPLTAASTQVWEELGQLRDEAVSTCDRLNKDVVVIVDRSSEEDKDKANMEKLLKIINTVYVQHYPSSPAQEVDSRAVTPAPSINSRGEFANVYRTPYRLLPSQIGPKGGIARPFSASFLPTLSPHSGSADVAPPDITSNLSPSPPMRYSSQHRHESVYYPPSSRSPSSLSSNTRFSASSDEGASGSTPASQDTK